MRGIANPTIKWNGATVSIAAVTVRTFRIAPRRMSILFAFAMDQAFRRQRRARQ